MLSAQLEKVGACEDAREWVGKRKDPKRAWDSCERGDWLLWIVARIGVDRKLVVLAACDCARLALKHTKDPRVLACIETTEAWCRGEATVAQVREARAYSAAAADAAAYSAAGAAYSAAAAAYSAAAAAYSAYSAYSAADAAYSAAAAAAYSAAAAAAAAAAYSADAAARKRTQKECARLVRKRIPWTLVAKEWKTHV